MGLPTWESRLCELRLAVQRGFIFTLLSCELALTLAPHCPKGRYTDAVCRLDLECDRIDNKLKAELDEHRRKEKAHGRHPCAIDPSYGVPEVEDKPMRAHNHVRHAADDD